jgi:hypothetical protein
MLENKYVCQTPIVLIIFNRPQETKIIIDAIKVVSPKKIFVISDGPRDNNFSDRINVEKTRKLTELIDWECDLVKIYREENLGCMINIVKGLNEVFKLTDKAIILEDDCKPNVNFFKFMEWGLENYENNENIGMISGSNLIADKYNIEYRNGFSIFISIWGWATWKNRWEKHNEFLSIREVNEKCSSLLKQKKMNFWQRMYWVELFKFTIYTSNTWDFQLQYSFFKNNFLSVFPKLNLIENVGFSGNGTHTNISCPTYVLNNIPDDNFEIMKFDENFKVENNLVRDILLAKIIWSFSVKSAIKLKIKNILLSLNLMK